MSGGAELDLFGVIHQDDPEKVTEELRAFADGTDAVFVSFPTGANSVRAYLELFVRAPAHFVGGMLLQTLGLSPLYLLTTRDVFPVGWIVGERLREEGIPVHHAGDPVNAKMTDAGPAVIAANWVLLAVAVWLNPAAAAATGALAFASPIPVALRRRGRRWAAIATAVASLVAYVALFVAGYFSVWLTAVGIMTYLVVANRSIGWLHARTADDVDELTAEHGYDAVTVVEGKNGLEGLVPALREHGFRIRRGHVSAWRDVGRTYESFELDHLEEEPSGGADAPVIEPGSERTVAGRRAAAAVIDVVPSVIGIVAWLVLCFAAADLAPGVTVEAAEDPAVVIAAVLGPISYHGAMEAATGWTIGKRVLGLAVADAADGTAASNRSVVVRNVLRPLDVLFCYGLGAVVMLATERNQRVGDLAAGTVVGRRRTSGEEKSESNDPQPAGSERATPEPSASARNGEPKRIEARSGSTAPPDDFEHSDSGASGNDEETSDVPENWRDETELADADEPDEEPADLPESWQRDD